MAGGRAGDEEGDSKASELERDRECVSIEGDVAQNKQTAACVCAATSFPVVIQMAAYLD